MFTYSPPQQQIQSEPSESLEGKECEFCGDIIRLGHQAINFEVCTVKRGPKSGRPMLELDPYEQVQVCLHAECVPEFCYRVIGIEDKDYSEPLCSVCESKLYGDD